jgi:hypothetical protein
MGKTTTNLRKMFDELSIKDEIFEQNEPFQLKMKRNHRNKKSENCSDWAKISILEVEKAILGQKWTALSPLRRVLEL